MSKISVNFISSQTQFRSLVKTSGWAYLCFVWYSTTGRDFFPTTWVTSKWFSAICGDWIQGEEQWVSMLYSLATRCSGCKRSRLFKGKPGVVHVKRHLLKFISTFRSDNYMSGSPWAQNVCGLAEYQGDIWHTLALCLCSSLIIHLLALPRWVACARHLSPHSSRRIKYFPVFQGLCEDYYLAICTMLRECQALWQAPFSRLLRGNEFMYKMFCRRFESISQIPAMIYLPIYSFWRSPRKGSPLAYGKQAQWAHFRGSGEGWLMFQHSASWHEVPGQSFLPRGSEAN